MELYHPENRNFAKRGCDIEGFFDIVKTLTQNAWGDEWGLLCDDEPTNTTPEKVKLPMIVYDVTHRKLNQDRSPNGRRLMLQYADPTRPGEIVDHYKQWFDCTVKFEVFAATNKECRDIAQKLEDLITTYTGFFKEMGVFNIVFKSQDADETSSRLQQNFVSRMLRYEIIIEHTTIVRQRATEEVIGKVKLLLEEHWSKSPTRLNIGVS